MPRAYPLRPKNKRLQGILLQNEELYKRKNIKKNIDLEDIEKLAAIGATNDEICVALNVSDSWLAMQRKKSPEIDLALSRGQVALKHGLRRAQIELAMSGNVPLLIWLGKQCLGQSDKHEQNNKTEINVTVQRATEELRNIPRGQLLEALRIMEQPVIENPIADDDNGIVPVAE